MITSQRRRLISPSSFTQPGGNPDVVAIITRPILTKNAHVCREIGNIPLVL